ncbi:hypothetical protein [Roseicella aquatilis]|uniref:HEPN domain-containing protein n=1 Tax=Roseicella aquatilis TaxID=2527868 RepID=A0A4R4DFI9_9PROT|nr:hypothetical protein [Roseicella aquatilis]TCZ58673.1 hypothetical protein EXY23_15780 [Roseicella aquatilis]
MIDPSELLAVARDLADTRTGPPSQARLRRAVSTAYYALFHKVLRSAAERFMGPGQDSSAGYTILYRSFDHAHMKRVCEELQPSTLKARLRAQLRRDAVSQDTRNFTSNFPTLQDARHRADYDPTARFLPSFASALIDAAEVSMDALDRIDAEEKAAVLALLMVRARP